MEKSSLCVHCPTIHDIISIPEGGLFVELEALALPSGREAVVGRPEHRRLETGAQLLGNVLSSGTISLRITWGMSTYLRYGLPARDPQPSRPRHWLLHRDGPPEELCLVQVPQLKAFPVVRVVVDVGQRRQAVPPG